MHFADLVLIAEELKALLSNKSKHISSSFAAAANAKAGSPTKQTLVLLG